MKTQRLGQTSLEISRIGFGCSRIGGFAAAGWRRRSKLRVIHCALDAGITTFDTADAYADGDSELLLGEALRNRRHSAVVCTKGGYVFRERLGSASPLDPPLRALERLRGHRPRFTNQEFGPDYLKAAVDASLRRLQTDYIDLYQLHAPRRAQAESEELADTLRQLRRSGKIREFGVGLESLEDVEQWVSVPELACIQIPFGLLDQDALAEAIPAAAARGVGILVRGVMGGGWLNTRQTDGELHAGTPKWRKIMAYRELAETRRIPLNDLAVRFALSPEGVSGAILGMSRPEHVERALEFSMGCGLPEDVQTYIRRVDEYAPLGQ